MTGRRVAERAEQRRRFSTAAWRFAGSPSPVGRSVPWPPSPGADVNASNPRRLRRRLVGERPPAVPWRAPWFLTARMAAAFGAGCVLLLVVVDAPAADASEDPAAGWSGKAGLRYQAPVPGAVVRGFEPPATEFGAGHRGVDLDAAPGSPVGAAADGTVRFAGPVAGTIWISIEHDDGVVTSYGPVEGVRVRRGEHVARGEVVARVAATGHGHLGTGHGLHWGARIGLTYIDPLLLVEHPVPRPSLIGPGGWEGSSFAVQPYEPWQGARWGGFGVHPSPPAERAGFAVPPNPNHVVMVAGLGSSSERELLDPEHLGYDLASVTALSYAGRQDRSGSAQDPQRDQLPYGPPDTWEGVPQAAANLESQLRAQWAREPGRAVDLVGYSMGGVVVLYYLALHHDPYDPGLPPLGHVVTVASPLEGSDLAALAAAVRDHSGLGPTVELVRRLVARGEHRLAEGAAAHYLGAPAIEQLRPDSTLLDELAHGWVDALEAGTAGPMATGTRVLTVGGSRDQVVAATRSSQPSPDPVALREHDDPEVLHRVLPGGHKSVLETEAVREVLWRFLAGEEVVESPGVLATMVSHEQGTALRLLGGTLRVQDLVAGPGPRRSR